MSKISVCTSYNYEIPIEDQIKMIKNAGFTYLSIGGNYVHSSILSEEKVYELKALLDKNNLLVDTIHGYALDNSDSIDINLKVVNAAKILGAPVIVLHCSSFTFNPVTREERYNDILKKLPLLENLAKESNIKFAFENVLPGVATDFMEDILNISNPDYFGFCYDSSHDQIDGPREFDLLERQSERLIAVHISDRIKEFVDHVIPGEGFVDFNRVCDLLKKAKIDFPLLMEVMMTNSMYKDAVEFLALAKAEADKLYKKIHG